MKRLYTGVAAGIKQTGFGDVQVYGTPIVATSENEARGILVDTMITMYPKHPIAGIWVKQVSNDVLNEVMSPSQQYQRGLMSALQIVLSFDPKGKDLRSRIAEALEQKINDENKKELSNGNS
jgi:hypothetical protein